MPYSDSFSRSLKSSIHERVSKDKVSYVELTIGMMVDWTSQLSIQIRRVDQLPLLPKSVIP